MKKAIEDTADEAVSYSLDNVSEHKGGIIVLNSPIAIYMEDTSWEISRWRNSC
ncbi:hypothetical protein [Methanobacterium petrolearium]|uniref:hypothetical protein n=1 Tax=Methanobacterium petrolearium TaxID=710190 RepID=UPI001AEAE20D|nr:hypothetical protein [Methanobacterium petrolearium]MBP1946126.1 hypothetical protein [Methanobacterium petrolearium]